MDIQKLNYFISVAQHLNFTKAAQEHHIAQTAMSRHISSLENELGARLFFRNNRQVVLTAAGKALYTEALDLVDSYNKAVACVQNAAHGYNCSLKIGIGSYERTIIRELVKDFSAQYPEVALSCEQFDYKTLTDKLEHGLVDIIFTIDKYPGTTDDLAHITIGDGPWKLAVASGHPLAARPFVSTEDLKDQTVVTMNEGSRESIQKALRVDAREFIHANTLDAKLLIVESGIGVALVPAVIGDIIPPGITLLEIRPSFNPRAFVAFYLKKTTNPALSQFLDVLRSHLDKIAGKLA